MHRQHSVIFKADFYRAKRKKITHPPSGLIHAKADLVLCPQTPTSVSLCVMSGLTLNHSTSSCPLSPGAGVKVHPSLTVSHSAFWMVCGPEEVICNASITSGGPENFLVRSHNRGDSSSSLWLSESFTVAKRQNMKKRVSLSNALIFFSPLHDIQALGLCS